MSHTSTRILTVSLFALTLAAARPGRACSGCGCGCSLSLAPDALPAGDTTKLTAALRYDYASQTQLYHGNSQVDRATFGLPNDQEIQQDTQTHAVWLDLGLPAGNYGVHLQLPYLDRTHHTIAPGDTAVSGSSVRGLGDARLLATWHESDDAVTLWHFGLKLPSGGFRQNFASGPQSGAALDRGLQLGTGTLDVLAGCSSSMPAWGRTTAFIQADIDQPLAARADFKPGTTLSATVGLRWPLAARVTPELQLNTRWEGRETGAEADTDNSGGLHVYLSPGANFRVSEKTRAFAFVQLPVYRDVHGLQLEPRWLFSLGVQTRL